VTSPFLSEKDWKNLLREIHSGRVIPVVGPRLVTVDDPSTGEKLPLFAHLAPRLAAALNTTLFSHYRPERKIDELKRGAVHYVAPCRLARQERKFDRQ
jgi:hypothetical protein